MWLPSQALLILASCIPVSYTRLSLPLWLSLSLIPNLSCQVPTGTAELRAHVLADKARALQDNDLFPGDI